MISIIFGAIHDLRLLLFDNVLIYWKTSLVLDTISTERIIYC